jgi:ppGpp synthetase/RelA/SpoT-type nucleotidyltranferase
MRTVKGGALELSHASGGLPDKVGQGDHGRGGLSAQPRPASLWAAMTDAAQDGQVPFSIEIFNEWYDRYRARFLEPARENAVKALTELLDEDLSERDRAHVDVRPGRIKSKLRAWQKLNRKYGAVVASTAEVPHVLDDLVGLRVVCTNTSDLKRVVEILGNLEIWSDGDTPVLAIISPDSARDYLKEGTPSGYRAYHLNLCTSVPVATKRHVVVCELQLRTLLQDSWSVLKHEDTYKPGTKPPPLVHTLSKRMADLMATLDDMAQDLRDAFEEIAATATDASAVPEGTPRPVAEFSTADRQAAYQYLRERASTLARPIDWASFAWEMQREFGQDIANEWIGHGSFKDILLAAVPHDQVVSDSPGYVLPPNFNRDNYSFGSSSGEAPRAATLLHETDRTFPLSETACWREAYSALAAATAADLDGGAFAITPLTKRARDIAKDADVLVSRRQLDHIARVLLAAHELRPNMTAGEISETFRACTRQRATPFSTSPSELAELDAWLGG